MQEIMLGKIGVPAEGGDVRYDMAVINGLIYKVEILQNKSTFVKCVNKKNAKANPNAHILRAIALWAGRDSFAGLSLQDFVKKVLFAHELEDVHDV